MFFTRGKKLDELEKKLDMILKVVLDTQMSIQTRGEQKEHQKQMMSNYFGSLKKAFAEKGMDTSLFDQFETMIGLKK